MSSGNNTGGDNLGEVIERLRRSTVQVQAHRRGSGSGVIWSGNGRIVTNSHVVEGASNSNSIAVELWDGRRLRARVVSRDSRRDLAALQVEAVNLPAASVGDSNGLRVGELVIAVGNPLGFTGAASTGVVHRRHSWVISQLRLAPGNSGGPLANARGEVVGINTMIAGGLAFAIPSDSVAEFLHTRRDGRNGLGVVVRPVMVGRPEPQLGFVVLEVVPHSPADQGSLLQGDILLGAGGKMFRSVWDLESAVQSNPQGVVSLQFRRGASNNIRTVTIQLTPASVRAA